MITVNPFLSGQYNGVRLFLLLYCLATALQFTLHAREQLHFWRTMPRRVYGNPPRLLGRVQLPALTEGQFLLAGGLFVAGLLGATVGILPQFFLLVALIAYFFYFNPIMPLAYIQRKTNLIPIVLLILLLSPGLSQPLAQPTPLWPLWLVKAALAQLYLSAGVQKLRRSGWQWSDGYSLQAYLVEHYLWADTPAAWWLAQRLWLCRWISRLTLIFEVSVVLILVFPALTPLYVVGGLLFHLATGLTMRIHYLIYLGPVYLVFMAEYIAA